eukprot:XP_001701365.1 predicted protein [Chlamydomonas reinhardtii]
MLTTTPWVLRKARPSCCKRRCLRNTGAQTSLQHPSCCDHRLAEPLCRRGRTP